MTKINPRVDFAFKKLVWSEENNDRLIAFVNAVLEPEEKIIELTLKNPYTLKRFQQEKVSIFDIRAVAEDGRHLNIEMQITDQLGYEKRALYCWSRLYSDQIQEGVPYEALKKTIGIHVLNFNLLDEPEYHNVFGVLNLNSKKRKFMDLQLHTIEIKKCDGELSHIKTALDRWVTFLKRSHEFGSRHGVSPFESDPHITKAIHVLDTLSLTDEERDIYEGRQTWLRDEEEAIRTAEVRGIEKGREEGLEEGLEKGRLETHLMIANKMKAAGIDADTIQKVTGLLDADLDKHAQDV